MKETYVDGYHPSALHSLQALSFHVITRSECLTIAYQPVRSHRTKQSQCKLLEQKPSIECGDPRFEFLPDTKCSEILRPLLPIGRNLSGSPHPESAEFTPILFL